MRNFLNLILLLASSLIVCALASCGTTIKNQYTVSGNGNTFRCDSAAGQDKQIESSLGAAVSATAAASQQGPATNSGSSASQAVGE